MTDTPDYPTCQTPGSLSEEVEALRRALAFYADLENWNTERPAEQHKPIGVSCGKVRLEANHNCRLAEALHDYGQIARAALGGGDDMVEFRGEFAVFKGMEMRCRTCQFEIAKIGSVQQL